MGGTEIDVAKLYKEGLKDLQNQNNKLDNLRREIALQQARDEQVKADLKNTEIERKKLSQELIQAKKQISQQKSEIVQLEQEIKNEREELRLLKFRADEKQERILQKNKIISAREIHFDQLKSAIEDNSRILEEQTQKIKMTSSQLKRQENIISSQQRFLIYSVIIGLLSALLLVLTYIGYRSKNISNQLLEKKSRELEHAKKIAEQLASAKGAFLSNMSHELRSPLNAIIGFSQIINKSPSTPKDIKEHSNIIDRSANHLLELINDVLDMAKIEAGKIEFDEENIDFLSVIKDVEDMSTISAKKKGLNLIFDLSTSCPAYIYSDAKKVRRIFINLINNAIKFTEEGGVAVRMKCEPEENNKTRIYCEIEDSGIGIAEENLSKIFKPFEQSVVKRAQSKLQGTGLGLSISKELIECMQGSISVESQLGTGTVFKFNIVVANALENIESLSQITRKHYLGVKPGQKKVKALIVEDINDNKIYLENILKDSHCDVVSVSNGLEAVNAVKASRHDIIFMDRRMPVMDGIEATAQIRQLPEGPNIKIIAVTASAFKEDQEKIMRHGFDDFIRKPFLIEDVRESLTKHLKIEFLYQYGAHGQEQKKEKEIDLSEELQKLTVKQKNMLTSAVFALDIEKTTDLIDAIKTQHPALAKKLKEAVENYDFEYLQSALKD